MKKNFALVLALCFVCGIHAQFYQPSLQMGSGNAIRLNGINSSVNLAYNEYFVDQFSFSFNVKIAGYPAENKFGVLVNRISYYAGSVNDFPVYSYISSSGLLNVDFSYGDDYASDVRLTSNAALETGKWYKITVVYKQNDAVSLYINGVLEQTSSVGKVSQDFTGWSVGRATIENGGGIDQSYFNGEIDEMSIWYKALTQTEVRDWL